MAASAARALGHTALLLLVLTVALCAAGPAVDWVSAHAALSSRRRKRAVTPETAM